MMTKIFPFFSDLERIVRSYHKEKVKIKSKWLTVHMKFVYFITIVTQRVVLFSSVDKNSIEYTFDVGTRESDPVRFVEHGVGTKRYYMCAILYIVKNFGLRSEEIS